MHSKSAIAAFDRQAADYDRWFDDHPSVYARELSLVRKAVGSRPTGRALEVGVGTGRFAAPLGISIGIEPAACMARMAKSRGIDVVRACAEALPFRNASFDLIIAVTVICFLPDPMPALREAHRVLAPGGRCILAFLERGGPVAEKYIRDAEKSRFLRYATFYSREEVETMLNNTGFSEQQIEVLEEGFAVISAGK
jgi:SAM-dependent methyltransferase